MKLSKRTLLLIFVLSIGLLMKNYYSGSNKIVFKVVKDNTVETQLSDESRDGDYISDYFNYPHPFALGSKYISQ